jgi:hypothetical protein
MSTPKLYHFFPKRSSGLSEPLRVLRSFLESGLYLTEEKIIVPWEDRYGRRSKANELQIHQFRFCLTSISNTEELLRHALAFGCIGLEFSFEFIIKLGGFPVFYVPSPTLDNPDAEEYKGISLLYRIADIREVIEYIVAERRILAPEIDFNNLLGAIRFLGNICYPTNETDGGSFYNEREWRIIYGMTSRLAQVEEQAHYYSIRSYNDKPIHQFIDRIVLCVENNPLELEQLYHQVSHAVSEYSLNIPIEILQSTKRENG